MSEKAENSVSDDSTSKTEQARALYRQWIKEGFDFRNSDERNKKIREFCKSKGWSYESAKSIFHYARDQVLKEQGIDPKIYNVKPIPTKYKKKTGQIETTITPKPKVDPEKKPEEKILGEKITIGSGYSLDVIGNFFVIPVQIIHARNPNFLPLTDQEKQNLAESWKPIFDKYLAESNNGILLFLPAIVTTLGVLSVRLDSLKAPEDKKPDQKQKKPEDKKPDEKKPDWIEGVEK